MQPLIDVLIGYMRVSRTDGSQRLDLQRDALLTAGIRLKQSALHGRLKVSAPDNFLELSLVRG